MAPRKKPAPPPPPALWPIFEAHRKKWISLLTLVAALGGALATWQHIEPVFPAHRAYVRDLFNVTIAPLARKQSDIQIELAEGKRSDLRQARARWVLEYNKAQDATTKGMAEDQIAEIDTQLSRLQDQLKILQRLREKEH